MKGQHFRRIKGQKAGINKAHGATRPMRGAGKGKQTGKGAFITGSRRLVKKPLGLLPTHVITIMNWVTRWFAVWWILSSSFS